MYASSFIENVLKQMQQLIRRVFPGLKCSIRVTSLLVAELVEEVVEELVEGLVEELVEALVGSLFEELVRKLVVELVGATQLGLRKE